MIGNSRWHWANKITNNWQYFHTAPNPNKFKHHDYSKIIWASVGKPPNFSLKKENEIKTKDIVSSDKIWILLFDDIFPFDQ